MSVPSHFGRYRVLQPLATGEMGVVYLAEDPLVGRRVAIKCIRLAADCEDDDVRNLHARFEQEIQIAGTFTHPNIVMLLDVGRQDGRPFIAMEYVDGRNLRAELQATGPLPVRRVERDGDVDDRAAREERARRVGLLCGLSRQDRGQEQRQRPGRRATAHVSPAPAASGRARPPR